MKYLFTLFIIIILLLVFIFPYTNDIVDFWGTIGVAKQIDQIKEKLPLETQKPKISYKKAEVSYELPSSKWVPQSYNNCAPAATSMVLQHFGYNVPQTETKAKLRTNSDDKNVFIYEVSEYIKTDYGIENKVLFNGNEEILKTLITNDIYVVVEDWLRPGEDIGHILIIRGFDDNEGVFIADDSYFGVGIKYSYVNWDVQWKPYNREYMPVYRPEQEQLVMAILGEDWDSKTMYENSIEKNLSDTQVNPLDNYAWFNLGMSYYGLGDYPKSKEAFDKARQLGLPGRMLWYFTEPVSVYNKTGNYQTAIDLANIGLRGNESFAEMHYEKAIAYRGMGNTEMMKASVTRAIQYDSNYTEAKELLD